MALDPVQIAALLEDLSAFYAERFGEFERLNREARRERPLAEQSGAVLTEALLGAALGLPVEQAAVRRRLAFAINAALGAGERTLAVEERGAAPAERGRRKPKPAEPWIDGEELRENLRREFPRVGARRLDRAVAQAVERLAPAVARVRGAQVDAAASLTEAATLVDQWLPGWPLEARCRFLSRAGRSAPPPSKSSAIAMQRLGWMPPEEQLLRGSARKRGRRDQLHGETLRTAEQVARLTGRTPGQIGLLLDLLTGSEPSARRAGVRFFCGSRPLCPPCPCRNGCLYGQIHGATAEETGSKKSEASPSAGNGRRSEAPGFEGPRERLLEQGASSLSDGELLALILRAGSGRRSARDLAAALLQRFGDLQSLDDAPVGALLAEPGIGPTKAAEIKAALELGRRLARTRLRRGERIGQAEDVYRAMHLRFRHLKQEVFLMLMLNSKNEIVEVAEVSRGTLNKSLVHPREVFTRAVKASANAVIFVHNHPTGDPTPSDADREITFRLRESGRLLGINVLDHVILGDGAFYSFNEEEIVTVGDAE